MRTLTVDGLKGRGASVSIETHLRRFSLNALLEVWYLGAYDNLDPGPGGTIIDAGASVGDFTLKASKWVGKGGTVIAVEPDHDNVMLLKRNLLMNRISNVIVVDKAIDDHEGTTNLNGRTIETVSIDGLADEFGLKSVDSVKLDIEGAEGRAITGGARVINCASHLAVETHSPDLYDYVCNSLASEGYRVYQPSVSSLAMKMSREFIRNPFPFLSTEAASIASWKSTDGPFLWSVGRWLIERRSPDWFGHQRSLALLAADRLDNRHP